MQKDLYHNKKLRFLLAFLASIYIIFHGRPFDIYRALTSPSFYIALIVSLGIGLLLVYYIHRVTVWLDGRCEWRTMPVERSILQFSTGVAAPAVIDLILISIYFQAIGQNIMENDFLLIDYPIIVCLIIFFNIYYLIHYLLVTDRAGDIAEDFADEQQQGTEFTVEYKDISVQLLLANILCFYRSSRKITIIATDNKEYTRAGTITNIAKQFNDAGFIQINRTVIINLSTVEGFKKGPRKNTIQLLIKQDVEIYFQDLPEEHLLVTKEYIDKFRSAYAGQEEI
jgi:hypothetical protein